MSAFIALGPDQEDDASSPEREALQSKLTVVFTVVFQRDHRRVEGTFQLCEIDAVLLEVRAALGLVPGDHLQTVDAV